MKFEKFILFILVAFFFNQNINAQSTLINALPLEYNPSFAGSAGNGRLASNVYGEEVKSSNFREITGTLSYDQFIPKIASGVGFTFGYINSYIHPNVYSGLPIVEPLLKSRRIFGGVTIAPKISIKGRFSICPSLQATISNSKGDINSIKNQKDNLRFRAGLLINSKKFFVGYTINLFASQNLNYPSSFFPNYQDQFHSNLQFGYIFQKRNDSKFSFNPQGVIYLGKNIFKYSDFYANYVFNLNFRYKKVLWGLDNGNDRAGIMTGYQNEKVKVMFAFYMLPVGKNGLQISFKYLLPSKKAPVFPKNNY